MRTVRRLLPALLLCAPLELQAQQSAEFGERVEVEVVSVDVVITDRDGNLVRGLSREDFTIEVDGRPVEIDYFSPPRGLAAEAGTAAAPTGAPAEPGGVPSNLLVFLDQSALDIRSSDLVLAQLREFVLARASAGDRVLIAAFADNLRILAPGTSDPAAIEAALADLEKIRGRGTRLAAERSALEREIRLKGQGRTTPGSTSTPVDAAMLDAEIRRFADEDVDRQRRLMEALAHWIGTFAAMEGRKSLLLATPGFAANPSSYLAELSDQQQRTLDPTGQARRGSLQTVDLNVYTDYERLLVKAQDARIAVYTLVPPVAPPGSNSVEFGTTGPGSTAPPPRDQGLIEAASSLARLSDATGGRSFSIDEALGDRLDLVADDAASAYSLGFTTGPEAGTKLHAIAVRVRPEGLVLRHREAFRRETKAERIEEALAAAASIGIVDLSFTLTLEPGPVAPSPREKKAQLLPLAVRIPLSAITLAPEAAKKRSSAAGPRNFEGRFAVRFAVRDSTGDLHFGKASSVTVTIPEADLARARESAWVHRGEIDLKPGSQRVAVIVVDEASGIFATTEKQVEIPAR